MIPSNNHKPGPELDRLVAEAMGWQMDSEGTESWWAPPEGRLYGQNRSFPRAYSTAIGPQTQEMLDWLNDGGFETAVWTQQDGAALAAWRAIPDGRFDEFCGTVDAEGGSVTHAISLLVLAVAEWRTKQNAAPAPDSMGGA